MKVIGITGGVGSGKSQVLGYLEKTYKAKVCQLDEVGKELQKRGKPCFQKIVETFGEQVIGEDGELNRPVLSSIVFQDADKLEMLNEIVHPQVKVEVTRQIIEEQKKDTPLFVIESALLPEAGYEDICQDMWYIYTKEAIRRERLKASRGYSDERITRMIASQNSEELFREVCTHVIDNSGDFKDTEKQIGEIL
ncbi:dephospho-CoA kinase [Mediterraneibacter sp. NSJ-151]|uniref:dephospho-CoA kinase n=1 Tax=Mediterraneibacter sp. NSJ-151 TaxID=2897708 RepID=UPI001F0AE874|nr:dephospho-CoA kinase [Mediterraneibacter sp. NSJ-151]MCH4281049.1 dephospho-CoA kinase [Mediterraneibacter sp. NSJ-151]